FLLDVLDNLPRLRLSSSQLKMVMWVMKHCNPTDVPSFSSFRAKQRRLQKACGIKTVQHTSELGHIFYVNDIRDIISKDFANPETAKNLQFYPEETDDSMSEVWHASRWREYPLDQLTPSYNKEGKRFYVNELSKLTDGRLVIPYIWIMYKGKVHARCRQAYNTEVCVIHVIIAFDELRVSVDDLDLNYLDLLQLEIPLTFQDQYQSYAEAMPNNYRAMDKDHDFFTIWTPLWADDVSGARSKQYQKHVNVYMSNSNLPGQLLQQEYFVHFVATSPHASAPELLGAVMTQVEDTHQNPVECYNAFTHRPCSFRIQVPNLPADNPQQSEECSHIGHHGLYFCRICKVGGSYEMKESDSGYHALYNTGQPRSATETLASIREQLRLATYGVAAPIEELQTKTGVKDKITQHWIGILITKANDMKRSQVGRSPDEISTELLAWLNTQSKLPFNPLLNVKYLNPPADTPVELLHTVLLGIEKYNWHGLHTSWSSQQQDLFTVRLQSTDLDGLNVPPIRAGYMMQYPNGLIGKHFKTLMQTVAFHVQDIVSDSQLTLIKSIGELGALLWMAEIEGLDEYLKDLEILIDNVLDAFATIDPSKILIKLKLHILKHIPDNIRRFGPAVRFSTEVFECFNAIFRMSSVLSNHQAPSRDIALKNGELDRVKHILSGGFWFQSDRWVRGGDNVVRLLQEAPILQQHLGWVSPHKPIPSSVRCAGRKKREQSALLGANTKAIQADWSDSSPRMSPNSSWYPGVEVIAQSGDRCAIGSWVTYLQDDHFIGRITEILTSSNTQISGSGLLTVERFSVAEERHHYLGMPVLYRYAPPSDGDDANSSAALSSQPYYQVIPSKSIQFNFNVQHDCRLAGCGATATERQVEERTETQREIKVIEHVDQPRFIINTHALHNAARLRKYLPRYLTAPRPLFSDRLKRHHELATVLRTSQAEKRAQTQAKAKATRERNKRKAQEARVVETGQIHQDDSMLGDRDEHGYYAQVVLPPRKRARPTSEAATDLDRVV
ncbi:hypothetical protein BDZ97DRAFT_1667763, partial [Flammula alnicola]